MELKRFIFPLIKWWWLIALATIVAGTASFLSVSKQPPIYQSRTTLMVGRVIDNPNPSNADFSVGQQLATTYVNIASTQQMRRRTMEALGISWMPEYVVQPVPNTELIAVVVSDTSPERAQAVANEIARQLVLQSPTTPSQEQQDRQRFIEGQLAELERSIQTTQEEISDWQARLNELIGARELEDAQTQIRALETKLNTQQSIYASLLASTEGGASNTIRIIDPAFLPVRPIGPRIGITVLTAASVGLFLAAAAAYVLEYLDDSIRTPDDIRRASGLSTLAGIGRLPMKAGDSRLITLKDPRSPIAEAFRALRTSIQFSNLEEARRTLLITSPLPVEGKSFAAANLAVVLAQGGNRVLLIDADLHRPVQHINFGLSNEQGLTSLLLPTLLREEAATEGVAGRDMSSVRGVIQATAQNGLYVLASGPLLENPSELFTSAKMKSLLATLGARFDYIILDSPPVLAITDATILGAQVDNVLVIVSAGQTSRKQLKTVIARLQAVNSNVAGVILNRVSPSRADYRPYNSYYRSREHNGQSKANGSDESAVGMNGNRRLGGLIDKLRQN